MSLPKPPRLKPNPEAEAVARGRWWGLWMVIGAGCLAGLGKCAALVRAAF